MDKKKRMLGITCGIMTGVGWGLSGVFSQYLFSNTTMQPGWFVAIRMLLSGIGLLIYTWIVDAGSLRKMLHHKKDFIQCILAGVLGNMLFQLFCYSAVKEANAPTAIVLQYLCPVMVIIYASIRKKKLPKKLEVLSILFAVTGIFLISTHGDIHQLVLTPKALFFGVGCAFFMTLGTVIPERLYKDYSVQSITSVMLLSGGIVAVLFVQPWKNIPAMQTMDVLSLALAILFGSVLAYLTYALAIKHIGSSKASLCACAEIPIATVLSILFLGSTFEKIDFAGFVLIVSTIFLTSVKQESEVCANE
ncbi:MAG: DMT family transporter [Butyribacter sp.]|nr:DMT family transporter [bacterium]MDY3854728.1 DMT family transporter [Butyribacter sp.]